MTGVVFVITWGGQYPLFTVQCALNTEHGGAEHCPGTRDMVEVGIL